MQMIKKDTMTSLELLEQINFFRRQEGSRVDMLHKTLLENIRDEFNCNIGEQYSLPTSTYKDIQGKDRIMYILTLSQGKQILAREFGEEISQGKISLSNNIELTIIH